MVPAEPLMAPEAVRSEVLADLGPLPPRPVPLEEADRLVLARPVVAPFDLPRFPNAAMDGYAVRAADTAPGGARLRVVGRSLAGEPCRVRVGPGEAVAIATGAPLPEGADAVVPVEDVAGGADPDRIEVPAPVPAGRHVRAAGEDLRAGDTVLEAGSVLGPGQVAAVAALGLAEVEVHPRPRVAIVPTGQEVAPPGGPLGPGQVHDAVSAPLGALLREVGAVPVPRPVAPDDPAGLVEAVRQAAGNADAVITVGGVSVGPRDLVGRLDAGGHGRMRSYRVALRPAKPFAFGRLFGVPVFGLPGNPASALASFEELVRPAVLCLLGRAPAVRPARRATLAEPVVQKPGRLHLVRAEVWREGDRWWARPAGRPGAGMIHSLARAGAWAVIPPHVEELPAGAEVEVRLLLDPP